MFEIQVAFELTFSQNYWYALCLYFNELFFMIWSSVSTKFDDLEGPKQNYGLPYEESNVKLDLLPAGLLRIVQFQKKFG